MVVHALVCGRFFFTEISLPRKGVDIDECPFAVGDSMTAGGALVSAVNSGDDHGIGLSWGSSMLIIQFPL